MKDIENLDVEDLEIENPYSKNPYWKNSDKFENLDPEEIEYKQKLKKYHEEREALSFMAKVLDYKINMFAFITVASLTCLMFIFGIICAQLSLNDGDFQTGNNIAIASYVFGALSVYTFIEILCLQKQFPFRKTQLFKDFAKILKKNRKNIRKYSRSLVPPKKPGEWTIEDWLEDN